MIYIAILVHNSELAWKCFLSTSNCSYFVISIQLLQYLERPQLNPKKQNTEHCRYNLRIKHETRSLSPNVKKYKGARVSHQTC